MVYHRDARVLHQLDAMGRRILVVEPYEAIRELLNTALRRTGHELEAAGTGNEAIAAMEREYFPCVIVGSPVVVAAADPNVLFLEYVEKHCPQWRPCLIVLTTHVEAGLIVDASERLRVCAVLAKPFAADELLEVVDGCLAGRHTPTRWIGIPKHRAAPATRAQALT